MKHIYHKEDAEVLRIEGERRHGHCIHSSNRTPLAPSILRWG